MVSKPVHLYLQHHLPKEAFLFSTVAMRELMRPKTIFFLVETRPKTIVFKAFGLTSSPTTELHCQKHPKTKEALVLSENNATLM